MIPSACVKTESGVPLGFRNICGALWVGGGRMLVLIVTHLVETRQLGRVSRVAICATPEWFLTVAAMKDHPLYPSPSQCVYVKAMGPSATLSN